MQNEEFPPQYEPQKVESAIYQMWLDADIFHARAPSRGKAAFSMVIPPPNVTGALHLGHALNATVQDILARRHRMAGDETLWMPGIDHAGIATQAVVERTIFEAEKKTRHDLGREELVRRIWAWKERFGDRILKQLQTTGASCDWQRTRFTLDAICARAVYEAFFRMFSAGLIFRGKRLVNWDTHLQTAVADDEVYHETVHGELVSIRYPVADAAPDEPQYLVVATTRPETMLGDTALAVHPDDPRYARLIGRDVLVPLVGRRIPIVADGILVDPAFGTGVVKVTPAHDPNDYATGQRHNLPLVNLLSPDGRVNDNGQGTFGGRQYSYTGLKFATEARKRVLADLEALDLIAARQPHEHQVGHSDRSKTPVEPYLSDQWFVRMGDIPGGITLGNGSQAPGLAQAAMDAAASGQVRIVPERYQRSYLDWLSQKRDWCISRQLWWGHRIPIWSGHWDGQHLASSAHGQRLLVQIKGLVAAGEVAVAPCPPAELPSYQGAVYICFRRPDAFGETPAAAALEQALEASGFTRDPDVLDTWFSSALWPLSTLGWPENGTSPLPEDQLLPGYYPTSVLSTAREILTLWVARMVIFGVLLRGEVPFKQVYIHAVIQDGQGRPMKKTLGNGVDPVDIVDSHGADALRFTLCSMATETQDIRLPVERDKTTGRNTSPRFDSGRNFANKIWNASRFILANCDPAVLPMPAAPAAGLALADRWILSRLNAAVQEARRAIDGFHFAEYANALYQFFWTDLCDWYLEIAKQRIRGRDPQVQQVLVHCLRTSLALLHPVMPFVTEAVWSRMAGAEGMLAIAPFPLARPEVADAAAQQAIGLMQEVVRAIRDVRNQYRIDLKTVLAVHLQADPQAIASLEENRQLIESLAGARLEALGAAVEKPENAATVVLPGIQVFVAGVVDKDAEAKKLSKRQAELEKFLASGRTRLADAAFTSKAPAKVVETLRQQVQKQEEELAALGAALGALSHD